MKPILFNTAMVRGILDGKKTCTRRLIKNKYTNADIKFWEHKVKKILVYAQNDVPEPKINEDGSKTMTVRYMEEIEVPYKVGDILYVRETWANTWTPDGEEGFIYKADGKPKDFPYWGNAKQGKHEVWMPSIHMPKIAARIFLKVTSVRAERLQDIDEEQAKKEGARKISWYQPFGTKSEDEQKYVGSLVNHKINYKTGFADIWDRTVKEEKYSWEGNPWVWVIEFERVEKGE
ncbi:hypothetical protein WHY33_15700 (plasmid) [Clostridium perfringens]|uniref:hypothetical protein n=1 Tax=Clostridium perfringens TaxID=1502 RepID=UPI0030D32EBB